MKRGHPAGNYHAADPVTGFFYGVTDGGIDPKDGVDRLLNEQGFASAARVRQVHGKRIVSYAEARSGDEAADAIIVAPGEAAVIRVADCVPVLLMASKTRLGAAVHAGWRGTYERIAALALARLGPPQDVTAYLGPAIGGCCYEIDEALAQTFTERFGAGDWLTRPHGAPHLDLRALNAAMLHSAGVRNVRISPACTFESPALHSFRRDGAAAGRLAAFVGVSRSAG